jgi:hypothetical protein
MTTIDEVIFCAESWMDMVEKWSRICDRVESENIIFLFGEADDGEDAVYIAHRRFKKALTAYQAQQDFEDKLEAQIAEEVAELMGDKV